MVSHKELTWKYFLSYAVETCTLKLWVDVDVLIALKFSKHDSTW